MSTGSLSFVFCPSKVQVVCFFIEVSAFLKHSYYR